MIFNRNRAWLLPNVIILFHLTLEFFSLANRMTNILSTLAEKLKKYSFSFSTLQRHLLDEHKTYSLFIDDFIVKIWHLRRTKEVEEAGTIFSLCYGWFGIIFRSTLFRLLLENLLGQDFPRIPFNLRPKRLTEHQKMVTKKSNIFSSQRLFTR